MLRRLILQSSHYTIGSLLVTLASIVSFPIFTRTFSVSDYGALSLVSALLLFFTGLGKLGMQTSIARFHAEVVAGKRGIPEYRFVTTVLLGMGATGLGAVAAWAAMATVAPASWWDNPQVPALLLPLSLLVVVRVLDSAVSNLLRAQQRSLLFAAYSVLRKYLGLALILALVFTVMPGLPGFFLGTFVVEAIVLAVAVAMLTRGRGLRRADFDPPAFRAMLAFGAPMIGLELAGIVLTLGDRYVIQLLLGSEALGRYAAASNLCDYVRVIVLASIAQAVTPIYCRMWEQDGPEATKRFVERALRLYLLVGMPVIAGMAAVGEGVLTGLASDRYATGGWVIPLLIAGVVADSAIALLGAGLYIHKQNRRIVAYVLVAAVMNVVLNLLLIPRFGIAAAALTTLSGYAFLALAAWRLGQPLLRLRFPLGAALRYAAMAAAMYGLVVAMPAPGGVAGIAARVVAGACAYAVLAFAFDAEARELVLRLRARVASRLGIAKV